MWKAAGSGNRMLKCNFWSDLSPKMCLSDLHFVTFIHTDDPVETWCIVPQKEPLSVSHSELVGDRQTDQCRLYSI